MKLSNTIVILAAIAAVSAFPAAAQSSDDDGARVRVKFADLDLSHAAGRAVLDQRIKIAIDEVCPEYNPVDPFGLQNFVKACRAAALRGAQQQIAALDGGRAPARIEVAVKAGDR